MPIYEYQGQQYDIADTDPTVAKNKILKYLGTQQAQESKIELPKQTPTETFESNLLSPLMSLSRGFGAITKGGVSPDAHAAAVQQAEEGAEENPIAGFAGKAVGLIGPTVPLMAAAPALAPAAGLGGMGAGMAVGAASAPTVGTATGVEKYQSLLNKGAPEDEALKAGITEGVISGASNILPTRGGILGRMVQGAGINVGTGAINRGIQNQILSDEKLHQDIFDPKAMALEGILGAAFEGVGGSRAGERILAKNEEPAVRVSLTAKLNGENTNAMSSAETKMLKEHYGHSVRNLERLHEIKQSIENVIRETGDASPEIIANLQTVENQIKTLSERLKSLDEILINPKLISESEATDIKAMADQLQRRIREMEQANKTSSEPRFVSYTESTMDTVDRGLASGTFEEAEMFVGSKVNPARTRVESDEPKKTPIEVALLKIGQATDNPRLAQKYLDELQDKIAIAEARPDSNLPGGQYNARLQAMRQEQLAYQAILRGEQPDLTWFNNTSRTDVEAPRIDEQSPVGTPVLPENLKALDDSIPVDSPAPYKQNELADEGMFKQDPYWDYSKEGVTTPHEPWEAGLVDNNLNFDEANTPKTVDAYKPQSALNKAKYELNTAQSHLDRVNKQIANAEQFDPGTVDLASLHNQRKFFEAMVDKYSAGVQDILRQNPQLIKDPEFAGTKEAVKAEESLVVQPQKYDTVQDAINSGQTDLPFVFDTNPHLFNQIDGTNINIDKRIPQTQQTIMNHYVNILGLNNEKIFFVFDNTLDTMGNCTLYGNTAVIRVNPQKAGGRIKNVLNNASPLFKTMLGDKISKAVDIFFNVRIVAHELGHFTLTKMLREMAVGSSKQKIPFNEIPLVRSLQQQFDQLTVKDYQPVSVFDLTKDNSVVTRQQFFHEFFAEQVAKELINFHTLTAFKNNAGSWLSKFQRVITTSQIFLRKHKIDIDRVEFAQQITRDIIEENRAAMEATSKTIWENFTLKNNHKQVLNGMSLEDVSRLEGSETNWHMRSAKGDDLNINESSGLFSMKTLNVMMSKMFAKNSLAIIYKDNPALQYAYKQIREAERIATENSKRIWFGVESFGNFAKKSILTRFSDIKNGNSPYHTVKNMTDVESYNIHQVFKKGFEAELDYADSLQRFGSTLTEKEKKAFNTLANMFRQQYEGIKGLQTDLNKKHTLQYRKGWYPSERSGEWYVTIRFGDSSVHRQHFDTETAAKAFVNKTKADGFKHLTVDDPIRRSYNDIINEKEQQVAQVDAIISMIQSKYKRSGAGIIKDIENLRQSMLERGTKFGMHHETRSNLSGYKGSELYGNPNELGRSFKEAVIKSVDSYSNGMRRLYVKTKVSPMLESTQLDPNTRVLLQQVLDNDFSSNKVITDGVDSSIREFVERRWKGVLEAAGFTYSGKKAALDTAVKNSLEALYLLKIMAKGAFILSQPFSSLQALRHMSYDGGYIKPWISYGKGLASLAFGDKELKQAMYASKQSSNTFEPQFIDALHLTETSGPIMTFIKDWVMLRKPAEVADTLSRVITYAAMFQHYRGQGHSFDTAVKLAERGVDSTMIVYGKRDSAAMFSHMGFTGDMIRPLQTYPTAALGNIIADMKHMSLKDLKSFAPMINYALTTVALSGMMGLQFMAEYELIRKFLEERVPDLAPPALVDIMKVDESFEDRVEVTPDAWKQALLLGIPAATTGVDLMSSLRSNETLATTLVAIATGQKAYYEALPLVGLATDVVGGVSTLAKAKAAKTLGIEGHDLSVADEAKAVTSAAPAGFFGYGLKEIAGLNETKLFGENTGMKQGGKEGEATTERMTTDKVSGYLGTKSTEDRTNLLVNMRKQELDKRRQDQIKKSANLFIETGKSVYLDRLTKLEVTDKQLENTLGNVVYKKLVDQRLRYLANKQGRVNEQKAQRAITYGDIPE